MKENPRNEPPEWFLIAMLFLGVAFVIGFSFGIIFTWQQVADLSAKCNWIMGYTESAMQRGLIP